jgi:hypothetical protein
MKTRDRWKAFAIILVALLLATDTGRLFALFKPQQPEKKQPASSVQPAKIPAARPEIAALSLKLLEKQYDTAVAEIKLRIEQEHQLFLHKFMFVGVALGILISGSVFRLTRSSEIQFNEVALICCWVAVAIAAIIDVRLMFNTTIIGTLGGWIKTLEDGIIGPQLGIAGWETYYHEHSVFFQPYVAPWNPTDRRLLTTVLFVVVLALTLRSYAKANQTIALPTSIRFVMQLCLLLMALPMVVYQVPNQTGFWVYSTAVALGSGVLWVGFRRQRAKVNSAAP